MTRKLFATLLNTGGVAILLFVLLFADGIWATSSSFVGSSLREIGAVCRDPGTQWILVLCLACYLGVFLILERRVQRSQRQDHRGQKAAKTQSHTSPRPSPLSAEAERERNRDGEGIRRFRLAIFPNLNLWLSAFVVIALLRYALDYETAVRSMQIPVLMVGIILGKAILTWARWQNGMIERRTAWLIGLPACLLAFSALWQPRTIMEFQYRGVHRWSGVWDNPNLYGLLMGVGIILSFGLLVLNLRRHRWWLIPIVVAAGLCAVGLFRSYSRGAWLGAACGMAYLVASRVWGLGSGEPGRPPSILNSPSSRLFAWFKKGWLPLSVILASVCVLGFWQLRFSESRPAQRMFSVGNLNDFSWRNRVTAWEGAVRMMVDRPWIGFGWGQAETDYGKKYCPSRLDESAAIEMNDYFMIGISAGVPAMICFLVYIGLSLCTSRVAVEVTRLKPETYQSLLTSAATSNEASPPSIFHPPSATLIAATCRAGAIVLLVGFWFDGGLFKLPVATVFWMLMELGRMEPPVGDEVTCLTLRIRKQSEPPYVDCYAKKKTWLRWLAGILAVLAAAQTIVYLGTPFLPVGDGTLAIARKCLIQRKEANDFELLSANAVWRGQKLKVLLEHVRLANYNRQLINWKIEDKIYQDFVLSPVITSNPGEQFDWRRPLWEEYYLRIRRESSPEDAAKIVLKYLRERVTIATLPDPPQDVPNIWLHQITDEMGFEIICVAAFRSVGIPARLNSNRHAEFYDGTQWRSSRSGYTD